LSPSQQGQAGLGVVTEVGGALVGRFGVVEVADESEEIALDRPGAAQSQVASPVIDDALAQELSERLADVFRTAGAGDVLTDDVFLDGNPPLWRFQLESRRDL
jgi:hypothetical protein